MTGTIKKSSLALLSGAILALCFPPAEWAPMAFVALVPLLLAVEGTTPPRAFLLGFLAGLVYFAGVVWWVTVAMINYGYLPALLGWIIMLLMAAILALYVGVFAMAAAWAGRRGLAGVRAVLFLPAVWTALEWVRGNFIVGGFPWANLAYSQYLNLPFIQSAALAGPYGPGFLIVSMNTALAGMWRFFGEEGRRRKARSAGALLAVALLAADCLWGVYRLREEPRRGVGLPAAVIQGNIPQNVKWDPAFREATVGIYEELTETAVRDGARLVIWPEGAVPFYYQKEKAYRERLSDLARRTGRPILFGAPAFEEEEGVVALKNRAYYLGGDGRLEGHYDKLHLVPFGEYVPFKKLLTFAGKLVAEVGDFTPGKGHRLFTADGERFGAIICFEVIFPDLVRRFAKGGAAFMVNITNDAWYERSSASLQHFSQMVFRAVENGLPIARAANTGISGFVDDRGRILLATDLFVRGAWTRVLHPARGQTFYTRRGDVFAWACLAVLGGWVLTLVIGRFRRKRERAS